MIEPKTALKLSIRDNTAVLLHPVEVGEEIGILFENRLIEQITARNSIDRYHKIALLDISSRAKIYKYGQPVGCASEAIRLGEHVHIHNMNSVVMTDVH